VRGGPLTDTGEFAGAVEVWDGGAGGGKDAAPRDGGRPVGFVGIEAVVVLE
jgi:hypothetical protein